MNQAKWVLYAIVSCATSVGVADGRPPKIIFVDASAYGANDGTTWADAYPYLQDALADADASEKPVEIRVAQGIYRPDQGMRQTPGDRSATFQLPNGTTVNGGYAGIAGPEPDARDINVYRSILSGDLKGDDTSPNTALESYLWYWCLWASASGRMENSCHVVTAGGVDTSVVIDGFAVSAGNDNTSEPGVREAIPVGCGGGMLSVGGRLIVANCTFSSNSAGKGAAIYSDQADLTLTNCTFSGNHGYKGGGLYNANGRGTLVRCTFIDNSAHTGGGGVSSDRSVVAISHSTFNRNDSLTGWGGGISNLNQSTSAISNCLLVANRANFGGGVCNRDSRLTLRNCTFNGNSGSGVACVSEDNPGVVDATNCIFWDGGQRSNISASGFGATVRMSFCDIKEGVPEPHDEHEGIIQDAGNIIDVDPCFVSLGFWVDRRSARDNSRDDGWVDGDYHLKSQSGRWDPKSESWVKDDVTSPCIDAGDPNSPVGEEPFPNGGRINMGAYGGTVEASKSFFGEPVCQTIIAGDINGDCHVDLKDLALLTQHWLAGSD